jgi:hypothetical protein
MQKLKNSIQIFPPELELILIAKNLDLSSKSAMPKHKHQSQDSFKYMKF